MLIDLHTHSNMSDGSLSPSLLIDLAVESNLSVIALTDHDTMEGIAEAQNAVQKANDDGFSIELVSGVEISVYYKGVDIHVLGLFVDETSLILRQALSNANDLRNNRNEKMAAAFRKDGIPITIEKLQERANGNNSSNGEDSVITRAHFATFLVENGFANDTQNAFDKYVGENSPYYIAREYLSPKDGLELIHSAKGLAFLAHPFLYDFSLEEIEQMIKDLKKMGIDGIEAYHSTHSNKEEDILIDLASKNNLLITGGSDFHGEVKPDIKLGIGKGNMKIPYSIYEEIKNKQASIF